MIKKNYVKVVQKKWFNPWKGEFVDLYSEKWIGCYWTKDYIRDRNIRTFNERRQNLHAELDGIRVRGARRWNHIRHSWDDPRVARYAGSSWKDFTKRRKQWNK